MAITKGMYEDPIQIICTSTNTQTQFQQTYSLSLSSASLFSLLSFLQNPGYSD